MELKFQGSAAANAFRSLEAKLSERRTLAREFRQASHDEYVPPLELEQQAFVQRWIPPLGNIAGPILSEVQAFLAATGVIASILWPSPRRFRTESEPTVRERIARGAEIRALLGISEESILRTRTGGEEDARGGLFHFDEMIDEFARSMSGRTFVSFDIGSAAEGTAQMRAQAVRWLDEDTLDLWVNGRSTNLRSIKDELERVLGHLSSNAVVRLVMRRDSDHQVASFGMSFGTDIR